MDRLTKTLAGCGLALIAGTAGCRSAHDEVPPGRPYRNDGRQMPPVGFSSQARPSTQPGGGQPVGGAPGNLGAGGDLAGRPIAGDPTGTMPGARFGSPGTSGGQGMTGLGQPPAIPPTDITQTAGTAGQPTLDGPASRPMPGGSLPPVGGQLPAPGNDPSWGNTPPGGSAPSAWGGPAAKSTGSRTPGSPRDQTYLNGFPNDPQPAGTMGGAGQPPSPN